MEHGVGIACGSCDTFNPIGTVFCASCGHDLTFGPPTSKVALPPEMQRSPSVPAPPPAPPPVVPPAIATAANAGQAAPAAASAVPPPPRPPAPPAPPSPRAASNPGLPVSPRGPTSPGAGVPPPSAATRERPLSELSEEELMEQARNYVCKQCSSPVPSGQKFCGACGAPVPAEIQTLQTKFFGAMQAPGKARLILIRGDQGVDGLSYLLQGTEHVAGRQDAQILFPDDPWLSPRHANFIYRGDKLVVRDEGSTNGVYVRVKSNVMLSTGDMFLCGEQVFRVDATPADSSGPEPDQTYFYSSPKRPSAFRVVQVLRGGYDGMVHCARENTVTIGREDSDMNFPEDVYMSANHARVEIQGDKFSLIDDGSKNGTYVRINGEHELGHGDYLFLGKQLLRVEMTT